MKSTRVFRALGLTIILTLLLSIIPTAQVLAANDLALSVAQGKIGLSFTVSGTNFSPSTDTAERHVRVIFAKENATTNQNIDTNVTTYKILSSPLIGFSGEGDSGTFSTTVTVPTTLNDGATTVTVTSGTYYIYTTLITAGTVSNLINSKAQFIVIGGEVTLNVAQSPVGSAVTATGTGFTASTAIAFQFDGTSTSITSGDTVSTAAGGFSTTITVPPCLAGSHIIKIVVGSISIEKTITVVPSLVLNPTTGVAGTEVTVTGAGFARNPQVAFKIGGAAATEKSGTYTSDILGNFSAVLVIPASLTPGAIVIDAIDTVNNAATNTFTLTAAAEPPPETTPEPEPTPTPPVSKAILNIKSLGDSVGSIVGISGAGFAPGEEVTITYEDTEVATQLADDAGTFIVTFKAPVSKYGEHKIAVTDGVNTAETTFEVESEAPKVPPPLKPELGAKAKSPVTFDWSDVTDDSAPVTYVLQVADDKSFSEDSIVLEKTGLDSSTYILSEAEELELAGNEAAYYWRVKSVDAASNESTWTGAGEFYIPAPFEFTGWKLYLAMGVGAVLIFLIGIWVGRRTAFSY